MRTDRPSRCAELRKNLTNTSSSPTQSQSSSELLDSNAFRNSRSETDLLTKLLRLDHQRRNNAHSGNSTGKCVISADQAVHYCKFICVLAKQYGGAIFPCI
jgi:hypothetical protein